jgi:uncharacterized protein (TIGR04255 family)
MQITRKSLPEYDHPPVIETVLGVMFEPIDGWNVQHYGLFSERIAEYRDISVQPPVVLSEAGPVEPRIELATALPIRCWYADNAHGRLIQLQRDMFMHNWRRDPGGFEYPRYLQLKPMFGDAWDIFASFLRDADLRVPGVRRCEVTYINHIERGRGWSDMGDLPRITRLWRGSEKLEFLPEPEGADMDIYFPMPGPKDRLQVQFRRAVRTADSVELLQIALTARGAPKSPSIEDALGWFDVGHDWIVRAFTDLTTPEMHELWGRRQ